MNFLLSTAENLGILQSVTIWHDNDGKTPDWFLDKVMVKDMTSGVV